MRKESKELLEKLIERDRDINLKSCESMRDIWEVIKDRHDPFSESVREVISKGLFEIRTGANKCLSTYSMLSDAFGELYDFSDDDSMIDFLAQQQKIIGIADSILLQDKEDCQ